MERTSRGAIGRARIGATTDANVGGRGNGPRRGQRPPRGGAATLPLPPDPYRYTMADLEAQTGVNARTIRYYITQGLLPPAHGRGPSATYDLGHLLRLRAIQQLKASYLPLDEIKSRLSDLGDDAIAALLEIETAPPEDRWRRIQIHPDIELHVRERGGKDRDLALEKAVDMIVKVAGSVVGDEEDGW